MITSIIYPLGDFSGLKTCLRHFKYDISSNYKTFNYLSLRARTLYLYLMCNFATTGTEHDSIIRITMKTDCVWTLSKILRDLFPTCFGYTLTNYSCWSHSQRYNIMIHGKSMCRFNPCTMCNANCVYFNLHPE